MEETLYALFLTVLNLSVAGSYAILAVLAARLLLSRAPRKWAYALWAVVAFRLAVPFSFASPFSLMSWTGVEIVNGRAEYIPSNIGYQVQPAVNLGSSTLNRLVNGALPAANPVGSVNPIQIWMYLGAMVWAVGVILLAAYSLISLALLRHRLAPAVRRENNIYYSDAISGPFVLGWLRPRVYLPFGLAPQAEQAVLAHERQHLRRGDHWAKLLAFCLLTVHWFNPLCWLAFRLFGRDMELSCDEAVLARQEADPKEYSRTLVGLAAAGQPALPSPLYFGESDIGQRVKNALRWKKPSRWVVLASAALVAVILLGVAANPAERAPKLRMGTYSLEGNLGFGPNLTLGMDSRFTYVHSMLSSYLPYGTYRQQGDILTCTTEDGDYVIKFRIVDKKTIAFVAEGSSFFPPIDEKLDTAVEDGDLFRWTTKNDFPVVVPTNADAPRPGEAYPQ